MAVFNMIAYYRVCANTCNSQYTNIAIFGQGKPSSSTVAGTRIDPKYMITSWRCTFASGLQEQLALLRSR